jgi:hypothetical protein
MIGGCVCALQAALQPEGEDLDILVPQVCFLKAYGTPSKCAKKGDE